MYSRDYVIRLIQQFVVLLARIAGLKAKDDPEIILLETETGLKTFTGLDPELVRTLSAGALSAILTARDPDDHSTLAATAILLKTEGEALEKLGHNQTAFLRFRKALSLLDAVDTARLPAELRPYADIRTELEQRLAG